MASTVGAGTPGTTARSQSRDRTDAEAQQGYGWVLFAGIMVGLVGTLNFIYGIAAIDESKFYTANAEWVISDLQTWGWVLTIVGVVQLAAAIGIWMQVEAARWVGIATAFCNAVVQMFFITASPWLSLAIFGVDILIIYGLLTYGRRPSAR